MDAPPDQEDYLAHETQSPEETWITLEEKKVKKKEVRIIERTREGYTIAPFSDHNITTMTLICWLTSEALDLATIFSLLPITKIHMVFSKRKTKKIKIPNCGVPGAILSARYKQGIRGISRSSQGSGCFSKSVTIDMIANNDNMTIVKPVSLKLASGSIHICGPTSEEVGRNAARHLLQHLHSLRELIDRIRADPEKANRTLEWVLGATKGEKVKRMIVTDIIPPEMYRGEDILYALPDGGMYIEPGPIIVTPEVEVHSEIVDNYINLPNSAKYAPPPRVPDVVPLEESGFYALGSMGRCVFDFPQPIVTTGKPETLPVDKKGDYLVPPQAQIDMQKLYMQGYGCGPVSVEIVGSTDADAQREEQERMMEISIPPLPPLYSVEPSISSSFQSSSLSSQSSTEGTLSSSLIPPSSSSSLFVSSSSSSSFSSQSSTGETLSSFSDVVSSSSSSSSSSLSGVTSSLSTFSEPAYQREIKISQTPSAVCSIAPHVLGGDCTVEESPPRTSDVKVEVKSDFTPAKFIQEIPIPEGIDIILVEFFLRAADDFMYHTDYTGHLRGILQCTHICSPELKGLTLNKAMINYNYRLPFRVKRKVLVERMNQYEGVTGRHNNAVEHAATIEMQYQDGEMRRKTRKKNTIPCITFMVYYSGKITHSGNDEKKIEESYKKFVSIILEIGGEVIGSSSMMPVVKKKKESQSTLCILGFPTEEEIEAKRLQKKKEDSKRRRKPRVDIWGNPITATESQDQLYSFGEYQPTYADESQLQWDTPAESQWDVQDPPQPQQTSQSPPLPQIQPQIQWNMYQPQPWQSHPQCQDTYNLQMISIDIPCSSSVVHVH